MKLTKRAKTLEARSGRSRWAVFASVILLLFIALPARAVVSFKYLPDQVEPQSVNKVLQRSKEFLPLTEFTKGSETDSIWLRASVDDHWGSADVLQFHNHGMMILEAYWLGANGDVAGTKIPLPRATKGSLLLANLPSIELSPRPESSEFLLLKIDPGLDFFVAANLQSATQALNHQLIHTVIYVSGLIILGWLGIAHLGLAIVSRNLPALIFAVFALTAAALTFFDGRWLFGLDRNWVSVLGPLALGAFYTFVSLVRHAKVIERWTWISHLSVAVLVLVCLLAPVANRYGVFVDVSAPLITLLTFIQIMRAVLERIVGAQFILLGWIVMGVGTLLTQLALRGLIHHDFFPAYAVGSALQAMCISLALQHRVHIFDRTAELLVKLRRQNEHQKEMFAVVGHELRTPAAAIAMLCDDGIASSAEKLDQIKSLNHSQLEILEDLRVVLAPERALESKRESVEPAQVLLRTATPLKLIANDAGIAIKISSSAGASECFEIYAQPFRQIVTNLAKNAICHSGGTRVEVSLTEASLSSSESEFLLEIQDDGTGIPEKNLDRLLLPFERGESQAEGSGLGLFIVQQLTARLGGTLAYSTSQWGGAAFRVRFKATRSLHQSFESTEMSSESSLLPTASSNQQVLLVEDDNFLRKLTKKMLSRHGFDVVEAEHGAHALSLHELGKFDLILTDLMMPELDGLALTSKLRERGENAPIFGLTAAILGGETDELLDAGATAVLSKPLRMEEFMKAVTASKVMVKKLA